MDRYYLYFGQTQGASFVTVRETVVWAEDGTTSEWDHDYEILESSSLVEALQTCEIMGYEPILPQITSRFPLAEASAQQIGFKDSDAVVCVNLKLSY